MTHAKSKSKALAMVPPVAARVRPEIDALNDFVLVRPIEKRASDVIEESDHYKQNQWAVVVSVGQGRVVNGLLIPIDLIEGDEVYITKHPEDVEIDGQKLQLVHAAEVKLKRRATCATA